MRERLLLAPPCQSSAGLSQASYWPSGIDERLVEITLAFGLVPRQPKRAMLIVVSPAKSLDYETPLPTEKRSKAVFLEEASELVSDLKELSPDDLSGLMGISEQLGLLNFERYQQWSLPFRKSNARQALFAFKGDVYLGLDAYKFSEDDIGFAQDHLRILSGLYGVLRPLDLMQAYRLEMGTKFANEHGANLYKFWGKKISERLNKQLKTLGSQTLVNLASNEYFKSVDLKALDAKVVTPVFKDWKNGKYKIISFFAKKARGRMSAYAIQNRLSSAEDLKSFDWDGYQFVAGEGGDNELLFTRRID
tara:strand:- start:112320 stop:113237 length:918 start_codon:yes stop_codon:yes gene_type:complete